MEWVMGPRQRVLRFQLFFRPLPIYPFFPPFPPSSSTQWRWTLHSFCWLLSKGAKIHFRCQDLLQRSNPTGRCHSSHIYWGRLIRRFVPQKQFCILKEVVDRYVWFDRPNLTAGHQHAWQPACLSCDHSLVPSRLGTSLKGMIATVWIRMPGCSSAGIEMPDVNRSPPF